MNTDVEFVTTDTTAKEITRLIFGRGINGVPVVDRKGKLVGFITGKDILSKFYPTVQEYIEDPVNTKDFELMEENIFEIFNLTADKLMSRDIKTVSPHTPVLHAHSLMTVNKIGRLPVVDKGGKLIGIVSKGDVFRSVVAGKIPYVEDEEYHDWLSRHWDLVIPWKKRLSHEVPDLIKLFRKAKVKNVLDLGSGTGEHDIALVKVGFKVTAIESSALMHQTSQVKRNKLSETVKKRLEFLNGNYVELLNKKPNQFEAVIFMGNALLHNGKNVNKVLEATIGSLVKKGILILQIANLEKIFKTNKGFQDFNVNSSKLGGGKEIVFVEFYDPPRKDKSLVTLNMAILQFDGRRWAPKAMNSVAVANITHRNILSLLKRVGLKKVSIYGSNFLEHLFKEKFDKEKSDWLNIVARR